MPATCVVDANGCWIWQGATGWKGYGRIRRDGRIQQAHRWFYEQHVGPIPEGLYLDHLCRVTSCVNPDHLEPVTSTENLRRGAMVKIPRDEIATVVDSTEPARVLAERYGVTVRQIQHIRSGSRWKGEAGSADQATRFARPNPQEDR